MRSKQKKSCFQEGKVLGSLTRMSLLLSIWLTQIRQQSSHFLGGLQQLIPREWIDIFNEHELQLLMSGSIEGFDVDDLKAHTTYAKGYHELLLLVLLRLIGSKPRSHSNLPLYLIFSSFGQYAEFK